MQDEHNRRRIAKIKRFSICVAITIAAAVCAVLVPGLFGLPPFSLRIRALTCALTFLLLMPAVSVALSPRSEITWRAAVITFAIILIIFGVVLRLPAR